MKHATPLQQRQEAMKKRVAVAKAKTNALQQHATRVTKEARQARTLRDRWLAQLTELRAMRKRLNHQIEHAQRGTRRALAKAQRYATAAELEVERIDSARNLYREVING